MSDESDEHDEVIEIFAEYKKGFYSKQNAIRQLGKYGFEPNIAEVMLKHMVRDKVGAIRGYVRTPPHLKRGHDKWVATKNGCSNDARNVDTDNK